MTIHILRLISNFWWRPSRTVSRPRPLMLAGIHQSVFLSEWGFPEVEVPLDRMRGVFKPDVTFMDAQSADENGYRMWIYRKRNKVLFFTRGTMVSHLSCTDFKERWQSRGRPAVPGALGKFSSFRTPTLSLVA
jgi:hypothetical protein